MQSKQTSERCKRTHEQTSEWPSTSYCIFDKSGPLCNSNVNNTTAVDNSAKSTEQLTDGRTNGRMTSSDLKAGLNRKESFCKDEANGEPGEETTLADSLKVRKKAFVGVGECWGGKSLRLLK